MGQKLFPACCLAAFLLAGCNTTPQPATATTATQLAPPVPVGHAHIQGSEQSSLLLDNFTAFVAAVDGQPVAAGRQGWNTAVEIKAGHRRLKVEFIRGVFAAQAELELDAVADANYQVKYATDAELFGHNSYCDFWIVDLGSGKTVGLVMKAPVTKFK
ncbi:MAG: hypothetical protein JWQ83_151 [Lacunisphaera sp.]|nr:hypothetical protein [Lacunisphaera sp.]MDB6165011.1 hypothetical protein [Lacunisphaera sp.]